MCRISSSTQCKCPCRLCKLDNNYEHEEGDSYECAQCPYNAQTSRYLVRHMHSHSEEVHPCPHCEKRFKKYNSVKSHVKVMHTCLLCDFKGPSGLVKNHMKMIHEVKKSAFRERCICKTCREGNQPRHREDDKEFPCASCPFVTSTRRNLRQHNIQH